MSIRNVRILGAAMMAAVAAIGAGAYAAQEVLPITRPAAMPFQSDNSRGGRVMYCGRQGYTKHRASAGWHKHHKILRRHTARHGR